MRLWLVRHFEPDVASGLCYGQSDLALKDSVKDCLQRVATLRELLAEQASVDTPVFTSPLRRCAEIATHLSKNAVVDDRLRELNFGAWEMQSWEAIGPQALDAWANDLAGFRPPGGETGYDVQRRALHWLQDAAHLHDAAIAITHGGVMRALQAHHQRLPGARWLELRYDYGQLISLEFTAEQIHATPVQ